jgi:D-arabinose 1-dehydrogenase-like Zn-dependent alcohol dehydrogenase
LAEFQRSKGSKGRVMKAVIKTKKEPGIELLEVGVPEVRDTDILIKVRAGSLCV